MSAAQEILHLREYLADVVMERNLQLGLEDAEDAGAQRPRALAEEESSVTKARGMLGRACGAVLQFGRGLEEKGSTMASEKVGLLKESRVLRRGVNPLDLFTVRKRVRRIRFRHDRRQTRRHQRDPCVLLAVCGELRMQLLEVQTFRATEAKWKAPAPLDGCNGTSAVPRSASDGEVGPSAATACRNVVNS